MDNGQRIFNREMTKDIQGATAIKRKSRTRTKFETETINLDPPCRETLYNLYIAI